MVRRLGIVGDVHGNVPALRRAIQALSRNGVDQVACVGDLAGSLVAAGTALELLTALGAVVVRGNHDRWLLEDMQSHEGTASERQSLERLAQLPASVCIQTVAGMALVCHGFADNDLATVPSHFGAAFVRRAMRLRALPSSCSAVICGHTHSRLVRDEAGVLFVRVGALSLSGEDGCAVYDASARTVDFLRAE